MALAHKEGGPREWEGGENTMGKKGFRGKKINNFFNCCKHLQILLKVNYLAFFCTT